MAFTFGNREAKTLANIAPTSKLLTPLSLACLHHQALETEMTISSFEGRSKPSVLILDAHMVVADAFRFLLDEMRFCTTTVVKDALEARLEIIASGGFDLLVLDVEAIGLGSLEAVEKIVAENGNKATMIITNRRDELGDVFLPNAESVAVCSKKQPVTEIVREMRHLLSADLRRSMAEIFSFPGRPVEKSASVFKAYRTN